MEINQDDIFAKLEVSKNVEKAQKEKEIPIGYIPVNFISGDKLGPSILHFRNYSMNELLELSMSNDETLFRTLINKCLSNMNYEKFDCAKLHNENIIQIVMTIYLNFWGSKLYRMTYETDGEEKETDIDLTKLNSLSLNKKFKEPFSLINTITNQKVKFILPRIDTVFIAEDSVKTKYKEQLDTFLDLEEKIKLVNQLRFSSDEKHRAMADTIKIDYAKKEEYDNIQNEKAKDYLRLIQAQLLYGVDDKVFKTVQEKLDYYNTNELDGTIWAEYQEKVKEYATFGIDPNYTFIDDAKNKITRRFSFRYLDFIPTLDQTTNTGYTISFDD